MSEPIKKRINVVLVCGGVWHDFDFARLELLKLLAEDERIRTRVFESYDHARPALADADFLVSYTCNVVGSLDTQEAIKVFIENGGRWFALHGTNSVLRFLSPEGADYGNLLVDAPRWAPLMMETLGSQFIAHPPMDPYKISITKPSHPMVSDIEPFETTGELYLMETHGDLEVLLHADFEGEAPGFVEDQWKKQQHPVLYLKTVGEGAVLYLTIGHCRSHYDMTDITDYYPEIERGAWDLPVYYTLLRRGISWAREPALDHAKEEVSVE
ncbi:MAG: ThuA domain-containing protein [Pseudomonadota bacterium]